MTMLKKLAIAELLSGVAIIVLRATFSYELFGPMDALVSPTFIIIVGAAGLYRGARIVESRTQYTFYIIGLVLSILGVQNGIVSAAIKLGHPQLSASPWDRQPKQVGNEVVLFIVVIMTSAIFVLLLYNALLIYRIRSANAETCFDTSENEEAEATAQQQQQQENMHPHPYTELHPSQQQYLGLHPQREYIESHPLQVNIEMQQRNAGLHPPQQQRMGLHPLQENVEIILEDATGRTIVMSPNGGSLWQQHPLATSDVIYQTSVGYIPVQTSDLMRRSPPPSFHQQDFTPAGNHPPSHAPPSGQHEDDGAPPTYEEALHLKQPSNYE